MQSKSDPIEDKGHNYEELQVPGDFSRMQPQGGRPAVVEEAVGKTKSQRTTGCGNNVKWAVIVVMGLAMVALVAALLFIVLQREPPQPDVKQAVSPGRPRQDVPILADCRALHMTGYNTSGVYVISPDGIRSMTVYCEQNLDKGGWTMFQRRQTGEVNFYRNWADYRTGFGDPDVEYWLGNDNIHVLTAGRGQRLKVEMKHPDGRLATADYTLFYIKKEAEKYRLEVAGFLSSSIPGDAMTEHSGQDFSTFDVDNDIKEAESCAQLYKGGWWYSECQLVNLNGLYGCKTFGEGINWKPFTGYYTSLTSVRMMVK